MKIRHNEENSTSGLHNTMTAGTNVAGDITTDTDFRLDGHVTGDISCKGKIVVGPKASVVGNITADNAEIQGEIKGNLAIAEKLVLKASAVIEGDIATSALEIEPNARFDGTCVMESHPATN